MKYLRLALNRGNLRSLLVLAACVFGDPSPGSLALCWGLVVPGALLHLWARGCLIPSRLLCTAGPYRWTRNPFYLANLLIDLGVCAVAARPWLWAVHAVLFFAIYRGTILREERALGGLFGEAYREYRARVPRFFPRRLRPAPVPVGGGFSWRNPSIAAGVEYPRLLGFAIPPLLVWLAADTRRDPGGFLEMRDCLNASAAALVLGLYATSVALARRRKRGLRSLPAALRHPGVRALALAAFLALAFSCRSLETESEGFTLRAAWLLLGPGAAVTLLADPLRPGATTARMLDGFACLLGGVACEVPWLGILGLAGFAVLAIDSSEPGPGPAADPGPRAPCREPLRLRVAYLALFGAALVEGILKESLETGQWTWIG